MIFSNEIDLLERQCDITYYYFTWNYKTYKT